MIRKPNADWQRPDEGAAVRTVRTAAAVATGSARMAKRGGYAARGLICYFFAALWGFSAIASGLGGSLPSIIGIGAMSALMFWAGRRAFAKAREPSDLRAP
jgi:lipopolysaccharide export LptBFGC system permease protein LptF